MGAIMVGYDGSDQARRAVTWAAREAVVRSASLVVAHAMHPASWALDVDLAHERLRAAGRQVVDEGVALAVRNVPELDVEGVLLGGQDLGVVRSLIDAGARAQMLVLGSRGRGGFAGMRLGSVTHQVAGHAAVPVVVVPGSERGADLDPAHDGRRALVVGIDGSAPAAVALRWACEEAERRGVDLEVVHAYRPYVPTYYSVGLDAPLREQIADRLRAEGEDVVAHAMAAARSCTVPVRTTVVPGPVAQALVERAGAERVIAVGTRGRGGFASLVLGSVGHELLQHAHAPVVVVPNPEPAVDR